MRMWMTTLSRVEDEVWKRQGPMQLGVHEPLIASGKRKWLPVTAFSDVEGELDFETELGCERYCGLAIRSARRPVYE